MFSLSLCSVTNKNVYIRETLFSDAKNATKKREKTRDVFVSLFCRAKKEADCDAFCLVCVTFGGYASGVFYYARTTFKTKDRFTLTKELRMMVSMSVHTQTHSIASSRPNGHRPSSFKRGRDAVQNPARIEEDETTGKRLDVEKIFLLFSSSFFVFFLFFVLFLLFLV